jgi:putative hydrolase of HD superfamily
MGLKRDLELIYEIGCLRFIQRSWKRFLNIDFQNVSEHTLRVIWISLILAKQENVENIGKVIKMALVHDIVESRTGDVDYLSRQYCERLDEKAIQEILKDTSLESFKKIWEEYEKRETIEAKIVKDADNLDVDFELKEQESNGINIKSKWQKKREEKVFSKLFTNSAKEIWKAIQESNPHDWHLNASNRFNSGDWKDKI